MLYFNQNRQYTEVKFVKLTDIRNLSKIDPDFDRHNAEHLRQHGIDPSRIYQELEMESRYVDTHQDVTWSNNQVTLHSHAYYEILYCRTAVDVEYLVGSNRYRLEQGDIVFVPPGVSHRPLLSDHPTEPYRRDVLWLSTEFVNNLNYCFPYDHNAASTRDAHLLRTAGTKWEILGDLFRTGVWEAEHKQPGWEEAVLGNTMQLMVYIYRAIQEKSTQPPKAEQPELLDRVLAYIEANLSRKITLADTARHFWVSQSTISQTFRNKMGVSFHRCVTQRRLIAAKLLISQNIPLEDVGRQVGFMDYSTFYRAFKQEYGISPRQYHKHLEPVEES